MGGLGGHEEGLRRVLRGDAAGAKLGTDPADRDAVNVGSAPAPRAGGAAAQAAAGQVRHSSDGAGAWRSRRSTPGPGEPVTWGRAAASLAATGGWQGRRTPVNTEVQPWLTPEEAEARVLRMQAKLHQWAADDPGR